MTTNTVDKDFLQFYRLKNGLTQSELKELAGYPNIGKVERGKVVLSYDDANDRAIIKRIAKALKIKLEQLLCLDEKAAAENADANKFASLNLSAMRRARHASHKEVGESLGFPEKNAGIIIIEFERGSLMLPPDELTRIATEIFVGDSDEWHEKQRDFLTREFTPTEIVYIYRGETKQEDETDKHEDTAVIGQSIRQFRKKKGLSQTELAEKIGKSLRTIQKYEKGEIEVAISVISDIAAVLNVSSSEILGYQSGVNEICRPSDIMDTDDDFPIPESDSETEYELHLNDGRVITVKCSRYGGDICYEFYIARKKAVLEYIQSNGDVFICRKKDIFYIIRKGDER